MRILITGASGQLGSELKELAHHDPINEFFFLSRAELPLDQIMIIGDVLGMYEPELIIHAGAFTAVDKAESESELAAKVNYLASEEIAQYCYKHGTNLIAISTDYVFDGNSSSPLKEDAATDPINTYGKTKLEGERVILKWAKDAIILRTSWVYSTYGNNFVKTMIRLMSEREDISVISDQIGSPTYARDLAEVIFAIIKSGKWQGGVYHYSNEGQISWYDFACAIKEIKGLDCRINPISTSDYPTAAKRPKYSLLDKSKIKSTFGISIPEWRESLTQMIEKL